MSQNMFEDLVDWWSAQGTDSHSLSKDDVFPLALRSLGIISETEIPIGRRLLVDWHQDTEDTYMCLGAIDLEDAEKTRTVLISAHAVVTPPGINLEDRANLWRSWADKLRSKGVNIPDWYLIWNATIYSYYPPHDLVEYIQENPLSPDEAADLAESLKCVLNGLAQASIQPLGLLHSLRTDSFKVFYCGMGFDVGEPIGQAAEELSQDFERQVLPYLADYFVEAYKQT